MAAPGAGRRVAEAPAQGVDVGDPDAVKLGGTPANLVRSGRRSWVELDDLSLESDVDDHRTGDAAIVGGALGLFALGRRDYVDDGVPTRVLGPLL